MSNYIVRDTAGLFDPNTGEWVGMIDGNGREQVFTGGISASQAAQLAAMRASVSGITYDSQGRVTSMGIGGDSYVVTYGASGWTSITKNGSAFLTATYSGGSISAVTRA